MEKKELKNLKRSELLELLLDEMETNEKLQSDVARLEEELNTRRIQCVEIGSLAEAALALNHVFEDADRAAAEFLDYVHRYGAKAVQPPDAAAQQPDTAGQQHIVYEPQQPDSDEPQ